MPQAAMIHAHFDPADFSRIMRALNKLELKAEDLEDTLPRWNAIDYANLLRTNINNQKHMSAYPVYNERYAKWKANYALYDQGFWKAMGSLISAITFWKEGKGRWRSGIPAGITDSGGTSWLGEGNVGEPKPIAMYARVIEYGEYIHPERPIFRPTLAEYKDGKFIQRGEKALSELKRQWS